MDILRELTVEEMDYIICRLKSNLPFALKNLHYIYSAQTFRKLSIETNQTFSDKVLPTFYTHLNGLKENCTIFGITGVENHTVWYFSFDDSLNEIRECLNQTKLIRWSNQVLFVTLHTHQIQPLLDFAMLNGLALDNDECSYYYLPIEDALNLSINIPCDVEMTQLDATDATFCNDMWAYKSENSEFFIKSLIVVNGGYGLRDKFTKELLSFAIINDHFAIGFLTTIKKAQRKGYGEIVARYVVKKIAEKGYIPIVFIAKTNHASFKLFDKLGFKIGGDSNWISIKNNK